MPRVAFFIFVWFSVSFSQTNEDCLVCHSDPDLTGVNKAGAEISMLVDEGIYQQSIHAHLKCIDCHKDLKGFTDYPHSDELELVNCGVCHAAVDREYSQTMHGLKFVNMVELAPKCSDCHGTHNILPSTNPTSTTYFQNLPRTCCDCHEARRLTAAVGSFQQGCVAEEYLKGVHGKMLMEGNDAAPSCNTCHPAHSILKSIDPQSTIYKLNIGSTCGNCHISELAEYSESVHARALSHGVLNSAACTDCHGEHQILHPDSAIFAAAHDACIECHTNKKLIQKYNLPASVVSTYVDSYHGRSIRLGRKDAATCGSCHGNHRLLEARDPFSPVNENNLIATCSKCHKNVSASFARSYTHEAMLIRGNPVNYFITVIYVFLIVGVIGAMFLHNLIIFLKYIRLKKKEEKNYYVIRFKPAEIFQHAGLMISFTVLAISGFALKFPDAGWVVLLKNLGFDEWSRRLIHRIAAVVLVLVSFYHLYYVIFTARGKYLMKQILFKMSDVSEVVHTLKFYLGLTRKKPEYEEFDYTEKAEYWSLVWGNAVMTLTGIVLWFPIIVTSFAPSWIVRASELIHFYEAILATLAIVIFHLFFVIAHPEQYPMNLSWLTGKMSLQAAIHKHPRWIKRMLEEKTNLELLPEVIRSNCQTLDDVENFLKFGEVYKELKTGKIY